MKSTELFIDIDKNNYKELVGIDSTNPNYFKIAFINDGSGFITRGKLFCTSSYFIQVVDTMPSQEYQGEDTLYFIKD